MQVNQNQIQINNLVLPAQVEQVRPDVLGDAALRLPIKAELAEVSRALQGPHFINEDPRVKSISDWHDDFLSLINDRNPNHVINYKEVVRRYVDELLIEILRGPVEPGTPFPVELFENDALPIFRFMIEKMRNPRSIFYSDIFEQEAIQVLSKSKKHVEREAQNIPPEFLAQLNQLEADNARYIKRDTKSLANVQALKGRLKKAGDEYKEGKDQKDKEILEKIQNVNAQVLNLQEDHLAQKALNMERAAKLRAGIEELKADTAKLQLQYEDVKGKVGEIERGNIQVQIKVNETRAKNDEKKAGWLEQVACIAASIAVSWAIGRPVLIGPNGVMVG